MLGNGGRQKLEHNIISCNIGHLLLLCSLISCITGIDTLRTGKYFDIDEELYFEIIFPEEIGYTFRITRASDFGTRFNSTMKGVPLVPAEPLVLCSAPTNAVELEGNVVLVQRGDCSFVSKTIFAEQSGAKAVIIMDSNFDNDDEVISMQDDETGRNTYIPAVFLFGRDGYMILKTLAQLELYNAIINIPVNMTGIPVYKRNLPSWTLW